MSIEGIPEGWELVRFDCATDGEQYLNGDGDIMHHLSAKPTQAKRLIIRKIEKPKRYRQFENAAEYIAERGEEFAVDWKDNTTAPGFHAVVSVNEPFCWVAFGTVIERFEWGRAFEKLEFRQVGGSTSPFGVEVTDD